MCFVVYEFTIVIVLFFFFFVFLVLSCAESLREHGLHK